MARCVTCGVELHPERAEKYDYCLDPDCRAKNARSLTIASVGVNKAAEQFMILDERTQEEMASGRYQDARRTSSTSPARPRPHTERTTHDPALRGDRRRREQPGEAWTEAQQNLALALHITGRKSLHEIAARIGRRPDTVAKMIATPKRRWSR